jgi:hypothetical protein
LTGCLPYVSIYSSTNLHLQMNHGHPQQKLNGAGNIGEEAEFIFHAVAKIGKKEAIVLAELQRRDLLGSTVDAGTICGLRRPEPEPEPEPGPVSQVTGYMSIG